jgi:glyoxylase-like metal-dependent hydrolase (beta-lactamase superfamily II)
MSGSSGDLPVSRHFQVRRLIDGVYLAVATPGTGALGNAGIIDLGGETVIFDTMMTLSAARDLRAAAERLTGRAPRYVVNSHFHLDHTMGNAVFTEAAIIATAATTPLIEEHNAPFLEQLRTAGAELHAQAQAAIARATDPAIRLDIEQQVRDYDTLTDEAGESTVRLPDLLFDVRLAMRGATREARLITWGGGHTPSDLVLYLPNERILFAGDLIFNRCHASVHFGDVAEWLRILDEMERLDIAILAPGHGDVATNAAVGEQRAYLRALLATTSAAIEMGQTIDDAAATPLPEEYRDWGFASDFAHNIRALYARQMARDNGGDGQEPAG